MVISRLMTFAAVHHDFWTGIVASDLHVVLKKLSGKRPTLIKARLPRQNRTNEN